MSMLSPALWAVPGDILFSDDFQDGTVAPWTTAFGPGATANTQSGVSNATSSTGDGGTGLSMFTKSGEVFVTTPVINAAVGGARVDAWVRKGDDAFSEDPDGAEDLQLEYLSSGGVWISIQTFSAAMADGAVTTVSVQLPANALHNALQLRFHQIAGSNFCDCDYWHIDDVQVVETSPLATPPALDLGVCEDFAGGLSNWTITGPGIAETNALAPSLDNSSLSLYSDTVVATSNVIDTTTAFAGVRFDVQKGSNTFSEFPDNNEDLIVEYFNNVGAWIQIGVNNYLGGGGGAGTFFNDQTFLATPPASAQHANFQLRFRLTDSSGNGVQAWDYWHIDDVCILAADANLQATKTVAVEQDPVNNTTNPKSIVGAYTIYTITINETAGGLALNNSLVLTDVLPDEVSLFVGDFDGAGSPFDFTDGGTSSGISFTYSSLNNAFDDVEFLDGGGSVIATVTPDGDGFASAVRQIRINTGGIFQPNGSFTLSFRVRLD